MCSPPSSAIICPVMARAERMNRIAAAISPGVEPWPSGVAFHCMANWSSVWLWLFIVGPGPMALTLMRGASASARVCVSVHRPALASV